jgi:hypothetical protein
MSNLGDEVGAHIARVYGSAVILAVTVIFSLGFVLGAVLT